MLSISTVEKIDRAFLLFSRLMACFDSFARSTFSEVASMDYGGWPKDHGQALAILLKEAKENDCHARDKEGIAGAIAAAEEYIAANGIETPERSFSGMVEVMQGMQLL